MNSSKTQYSGITKMKLSESIKKQIAEARQKYNEAETERLRVKGIVDDT